MDVEERRTFANGDETNKDHRRTETETKEPRDAIEDRLRSMKVSGIAAIVQSRSFQNAVDAFDRVKGSITRVINAMLVGCCADIFNTSINYAYRLFACQAWHDFKCTVRVGCKSVLNHPRNPLVLAGAIVHMALKASNHPSFMLIEHFRHHLIERCGVSPVDAGQPFNQAILAVERVYKPPFSCANDFDPSAVVLNTGQSEQSCVAGYELFGQDLGVPYAVTARAREIAIDWHTHCSPSLMPQSVMAAAFVSAYEEVVEGTDRAAEARQVKINNRFSSPKVTFKEAADATGMHPDTIQNHCRSMSLATARKGLLWIFRELSPHVALPESVETNALLKVDIWRANAGMEFYDWSRRFHPSVISMVALVRAFESCNESYEPYYKPHIEAVVRNLEIKQEVSIASRLEAALAEYRSCKR
jgi:hypothetical protein